MTSEDLSSLRQPISLGKSDAFQIWSALKTGTDEVRNALINECQIIIECKVCSSLFRGLPNFLAHKRIYCTEQSGKQPLLMGMVGDQSETVFLEPTNPDEDNFVPKPSEFYSNVQSRIADRQLTKSVARVQLLRIDENSNAMSQVLTVKSKADGESQITTADPNVIVVEPKSADGPLFMDLRKKESKVELVPSPKQGNIPPATVTLQSPAKPVQASLTSNAEKKSGGKTKPPAKRMPAKTLHKLYLSLLSRFKFCDITNRTCKKCNISYQSFKSLRRHMFVKHVDKKNTYSCLKCNAAFLKVWNLTRHMMQVHKMSHKELDAFREKYQSSFKPGLTPVPGTSLQCLDGDDKNVKVQKKVAAKEPKTKTGSLKQVSTSSKIASSPPNTSTPTNQESIQFVTLDLTQKTQNGASGPIKFTKGFTLLKCSCCNKIFGKKEAYTKHVDICDEEVSFKNKSNSSVSSDEASDGMDKSSLKNDSDSENTQPGDAKNIGGGQNPVVEKGTDEQKILNGNQKDLSSQKGSMEKFQQHLYQLRFSNHHKLSDERMHQLLKIIDEEERKCLQCGMKFANNSGIHRHAVRHMGWKRFKCKLCAYMAFNRSDIKTHLKRVHPAKTVSAGKEKDLNKFMVELEDEAEKAKDQPPKAETKATKKPTKTAATKTSKIVKESPSPQKREGRALAETSGSRDRSRSTSSNSSSRRSTQATSIIKSSPSDNGGNSLKTDYNISTRRVSRTFDLRPCRSSSLPPSAGRNTESCNHGSTGASDRKRSLPSGSTDGSKPAKIKRVE